MHLDIKPRNILVKCLDDLSSRDEMVSLGRITGYLIDYGLSCSYDYISNNTYSCINKPIGRVPYIFYSPELANKSVPINTINTSSDIYSLGVTIQVCMVNPYFLKYIYDEKYYLVFHCQADQLNDEFDLFKITNRIEDNVENVGNVLANNRHVYSSVLFNLSVKMVDNDPTKRPTLDKVIEALESFE